MPLGNKYLFVNEFTVIVGINLINIYIYIRAHIHTMLNFINVAVIGSLFTALQLYS